MTIVETPRGFEISFSYDYSIIKEIKAFEGAKYLGPEKGWRVPLHQRHRVTGLQRKYVKTIPGTTGPEQIIVCQELPELTVDIPLKREPFPYQKKGIARTMELKRCINGDEPGLGKTGQSIAAVTGLDAFPCLVICPATLKENWRREWSELWTDKKALILTDKHKETWPQYWHMGLADVYIVNYESLIKYFVISINIPRGKSLKLEHMTFHPAIDIFKSIIIDESHKCKDVNARQSKVVFGISQNKEVVICLTGTPVVNKPKDLISQLYIINRMKDFGGGKFFRYRYCQGGEGASNLIELNGRLNQICFFRREKKEVLNDLPEKMREVVLCDISTRSEYNKAANDFRTWLVEQGFSTDEIQTKMNGEIMVQIQTLKNISARGKLKDVFEHVQEVVDSGEKIVIFIHLKEIAAAILEEFPKALTIRGIDDQASRQRSIDSFQNDPKSQIIICSIKAAGVGITLTASSRMAFVELPWHPADIEQCEARCHRIGLKNALQVTYFLGKDTIDEDIYKLIGEKRVMSDTITGANDSTNTIITDLTRNLFNQATI